MLWGITLIVVTVTGIIIYWSMRRVMRRASNGTSGDRRLTV